MIEDQNTIYPGFGKEMEIGGNVPILYDSTITGFRAARTTDYSAVGGASSSSSLSYGLTPTPFSVTGAGTIPSGQHFVEFILPTGVSGTVNGGLFQGATDAGYQFPLLSNGGNYGAFIYNFSGVGSVRGYYF